MVHDLGVVLSTDAGQELALRLRDAQALEGLLDLVRDVVPGLLLALRRLAVVDDLGEVDLHEIAAPRGHRSREEVVVGAQTEVEHPLRLVLELADCQNRFAGQAGFGFLEVIDVVVETVLVLTRDDLRTGRHSAP